MDCPSVRFRIDNSCIAPGVDPGLIQPEVVGAAGGHYSPVIAGLSPVHQQSVFVFDDDNDSGPTEEVKSTTSRDLHAVSCVAQVGSCIHNVDSCILPNGAAGVPPWQNYGEHSQAIGSPTFSEMINYKKLEAEIAAGKLDYLKHLETSVVQKIHYSAFAYQRALRARKETVYKWLHANGHRLCIGDAEVRWAAGSGSVAAIDWLKDCGLRLPNRHHGAIIIQEGTRKKHHLMLIMLCRRYLLPLSEFPREAEQLVQLICDADIPIAINEVLLANFIKVPGTAAGTLLEFVARQNCPRETSGHALPQLDDHVVGCAPMRSDLDAAIIPPTSDVSRVITEDRRGFYGCGPMNFHTPIRSARIDVSGFADQLVMEALSHAPSRSPFKTLAAEAILHVKWQAVAMHYKLDLCLEAVLCLLVILLATLDGGGRNAFMIAGTIIGICLFKGVWDGYFVWLIRTVSGFINRFLAQEASSVNSPCQPLGLFTTAIPLVLAILRISTSTDVSTALVAVDFCCLLKLVGTLKASEALGPWFILVCQNVALTFPVAGLTLAFVCIAIFTYVRMEAVEAFAETEDTMDLWFWEEVDLTWHMVEQLLLLSCGLLLSTSLLGIIIGMATGAHRVDWKERRAVLLHERAKKILLYSNSPFHILVSGMQQTHHQGSELWCWYRSSSCFRDYEDERQSEEELLPTFAPGLAYLDAEAQRHHTESELVKSLEHKIMERLREGFEGHNPVVPHTYHGELQKIDADLGHLSKTVREGFDWLYRLEWKVNETQRCAVESAAGCKKLEEQLRAGIKECTAKISTGVTAIRANAEEVSAKQAECLDTSTHPWRARWAGEGQPDARMQELCLALEKQFADGRQATTGIDGLQRQLTLMCLSLKTSFNDIDIRLKDMLERFEEQEEAVYEMQDALLGFVASYGSIRSPTSTAAPSASSTEAMFELAERGAFIAEQERSPYHSDQESNVRNRLTGHAVRSRKVSRGHAKRKPRRQRKDAGPVPHEEYQHQLREEPPWDR